MHAFLHAARDVIGSVGKKEIGEHIEDNVPVGIVAGARSDQVDCWSEYQDGIGCFPKEQSWAGKVPVD